MALEAWPGREKLGPMMRFESLVWIVVPLLPTLPVTSGGAFLPGPGAQDTLEAGIDLSSPTRAYETCVAHLVERPEFVLDRCFTEGGRTRFLMSLALVAIMAEGLAELGDDPEELRRVRALLDVYGLDREFESEDEFVRALEELDVSRFLPEVLELAETEGAPPPGSGTLRDVQIDGDRASGTEVFPGRGDGVHGHPVVFRRVGDRWLLDDWESGDSSQPRAEDSR